MNETKTEERPTELTVIEENIQSNGDSQAIMVLINNAMMRQDFDVGKLNALLEVKERWEANEARKAYVAAMSLFKAEPLKINKNKSVGYAHKEGGGTTDYNYATLDNVTSVICPALAKFNLSHAWSIIQSEAGISITCTLTHAHGHSESVTMTAPADGSGKKNTIQAIASTNSYLQRYTLLAITGLATADQDDDGLNANESISDDQNKYLTKIIKEIDPDGEKEIIFRVLQFFQRKCNGLTIGSIPDLPAIHYDQAVHLIESKRNANHEDSDQ